MQQLKPLNVTIEMPPEIKTLAGRLDSAIDGLLQVSWLDGFCKGAIAATLAMLILYLLFARKS